MDNNELLNNAVDINSTEASPILAGFNGSIMDAATGMSTEANNLVNTNNETVNNYAVGGNISEEEMLKMYSQPRKTPPMVRNYKKIGRNDPCPCGSGKKYKKCCLGTGTYDGYTAYGKQKDPYVKTESTEEAA